MSPANWGTPFQCKTAHKAASKAGKEAAENVEGVVWEMEGKKTRETVDGNTGLDWTPCW